MALVALEGRWVKVNRALCELVGYSEAELLARTFQDITHPDDLAPDLENVRRLLAGEIRFYEMEKRYIHARGHFVTILLNVSLIRDGQGQPRYFIAQIQDITERKQKEAELQRSQMLLRMAGRLVRVGAWAVSMPDLKQTWSDEVCAIYEVPMGTVLPIEETINHYTPESREIIKHAFETCMRDGTAYDIELQMTATSGGRWVRAIGEAERNAAGVICRVQGALQDITDRKRNEESLRLLGSAAE
jgi:PAS domain S-box-containing protein